MKSFFIQLTVFALSFTFSFAVPTEKRKWESTAGTSLEAIATQVVNDKVHFKREGGKVIKVPMDKLVDADQEFLRKHFELGKKGEITLKRSELAAPEDLPHPMGEIAGPIEANGSHYYLYLPTTLKEGRKAPLFFYTYSSGARKGSLIKRFSDTADQLGMVLAVSVESKNGQEAGHNINHSKNCVDHILETLPVDEERIIYSGSSGGAATAFANTTVRRAYGVIPNAGYIPQGTQARAKVVYAICGAYDFNRYLSAFAAEKFKKDGFHRMAPGGHQGTGNTEHYMDGMVWIHCKYLADEGVSDDEKLDFEANMISWLNAMKSENPERAYHTACILRDVYQIRGYGAKANDLILRELAKDKVNVLKHEAILEIDKLSGKYLSALGTNGGSMRNHAEPKSANAAKKLAEKYAEVASILEVLDSLMKQTD